MRDKRRKGGDLSRPKPHLNVRQTIFIGCEGENTEPSYFKKFRLSTVTIKAVGIGDGTKQLVEQTRRLTQNKSYDQVWVVFDKDHHSDTDFNQAIETAQSYGFGVAYSNQSFEYWLLLHLIDHQGERLHRSEYENKINSQLKPYGIVYNHNGRKIISDDFFDFLYAVDSKTKQRRINLAISRAKRIYNSHEHLSPAKSESSSTVYKLVEKLLEQPDF